MRSGTYYLLLSFLLLNGCGNDADPPMTVAEYEARIAAAESDIEPLLNRSCTETSQCRYLALNGLCEPHYEPYSTASTDAAALNEKVAAYEGIRHALYSQGTQYACPPVIYPDPPPLACVNGRCE